MSTSTPNHTRLTAVNSRVTGLVASVIFTAMALPESSPVAIAIFFSSLDFVVDSTVEDSLVCVLCSEEEDSSTDPSTLSEEAVSPIIGSA